MPLRFVFALHNHQPVGNFDGVFEQAYRDSYGPFLDLLEQYPEIPLSLHTSGCLMEWLVDRRPDYVERLRRLVARGQVEIMSGGFYEPILPMIPRRDRVGQIRSYTRYLEDLFPGRIRGMWVPERVWEQNLVSDIVAAGIDYTVLDDYHFKQAGLEEDTLHGYYLSEDEGRVLRIFPNSEPLRYLIPWKDPEDSFAFLGDLAARRPDAVVVCADDGEKFGGWPETHTHCFTNGWLRRFFDRLRDARSWLRLCNFSQALEETAPAGTIYLPDSSYREMTEWALPLPRLQAYIRLVRDLDKDPRGPQMKRFLRGGFWRNFKVKYPETQEMYARMMQVSGLLEEQELGMQASRSEGSLRARNASPSGPLATAAQELYRAQCNCPWWHGAFGGLYLPHLRNAVYQHLIAAENACFESLQRGDDWVDARAQDLNLDGSAEVLLSNSRLAAYFNPRAGGSLYELDLRGICHNLLATLSRRPEAYHESILKHVRGEHHDAGPGIPDRVIFKQAGLEHQLQYDTYLRKSLIDHFFDPGATLEQVAALQAAEVGDFVNGAYQHDIQQDENGARLRLERLGRAAGIEVKIAKHVQLRPGADTLGIRYILEKLPRDRALHFAVEFNFAGLAAGADDRYFYHDGQARAGQLQTRKNLTATDRIGLVDEWLGLDVSLALSRRGGIWAFPIQTVSQSEGGFELVHQSTAVMPHWLVEPDSQGRWEVSLTLKLDVSRAEKRMLVGST
jgi:alpha-amylase